MDKAFEALMGFNDEMFFYNPDASALSHESTFEIIFSNFKELTGKEICSNQLICNPKEYDLDGYYDLFSLYVQNMKFDDCMATFLMVDEIINIPNLVNFNKSLRD